MSFSFTCCFLAILKSYRENEIISYKWFSSVAAVIQSAILLGNFLESVLTENNEVPVEFQSSFI